MTRSEEQAARNETLFREVNERVRTTAPAIPDEPVDFLCECGDMDCLATVSMQLAEYEELRSHPDQFVVSPGHEIVQVETVLARNARYEIVRKKPEEAEIARETDPRR